MVKNQDEIEVRIAAFLRGESSPDAAMELMDWRAAHPDHEALFQSVEMLYNQVGNREPFVSPDVDSAWEAMKPDLKKEVRVVSIHTRKLWYFAVAALVVIAFIIGAFWSRWDEQPLFSEDGEQETEEEAARPTILKAQQSVESYVLSDRSEVSLLPGSSVEIPGDFDRVRRNILLKGSGTFDVTHNEDRPFTIEIEGLKVVDVGTVFSIRTLRDTVKVVVTEGEVQLRLNNEVLNVAAGDSAFYVISRQLIDRYRLPQARQDTIFIFDGTSLSEVTEILGSFFRRKIVIMDAAIANCPVSVTFKNEDLATILAIIEELLDVKIIRNNDIIGIYGSGCN